MNLDILVDPGAEDRAGVAVNEVPGQAVGAFPQASQRFVSLAVGRGEDCDGVFRLVASLVDRHVRHLIIGGVAETDEAPWRTVGLVQGPGQHGELYHVIRHVVVILDGGAPVVPGAVVDADLRAQLELLGVAVLHRARRHMPYPGGMGGEFGPDRRREVLVDLVPVVPVVRQHDVLGPIMVYYFRRGRVQRVVDGIQRVIGRGGIGGTPGHALDQIRFSAGDTARNGPGIRIGSTIAVSLGGVRVLRDGAGVILQARDVVPVGIPQHSLHEHFAKPEAVNAVAAGAVLADIRSPHGFVVGRDARHDAVVVAGLVAGGRQHIGGEDPEVNRDGAALVEIVRLAEGRLVDIRVDGNGDVDRQALAGLLDVHLQLVVARMERHVREFGSADVLRIEPGDKRIDTSMVIVLVVGRIIVIVRHGLAAVGAQ